MTSITMQGQRGPPDGGPGAGRVRGRRGRRGAPPARPHVDGDAQGEVLQRRQGRGEQALRRL